MAEIAVTGSIYRLLPLPASSRCIRILDVHGPSGLEGEKSLLRGNLRLLDLDSRSHLYFSALTYVWGKLEGGHHISCEGHSIPLTVNAHSALMHLRRKLGSFTIWIDAVCIDQENQQEKETQISLMGDVYTQADAVYVWLGEGSERTDRAITYLQNHRFLSYFHPDECIESNLPKPQPWRALWFYYSARFKLNNTLYPYLDRGDTTNPYELPVRE